MAEQEDSDAMPEGERFHTMDVIAEISGLPDFLLESKTSERWLADAIAQLALRHCGREELAWLLGVPLGVINEDLPVSGSEELIGSNLLDISFLPRGAGCVIQGSTSAAHLNSRRCTLCRDLRGSDSHALVVVQGGAGEQPGQEDESTAILLARKNLEYASPPHQQLQAAETSASAGCAWPSLYLLPEVEEPAPAALTVGPAELLGAAAASLPEHLRSAGALEWLAGLVARLVDAKGCGREEIGFLLSLPSKASCAEFGSAAIPSSVASEDMGKFLQDLAFAPQGARCQVEGSKSTSHLNGMRGILLEPCPSYVSHAKVNLGAGEGEVLIHRKNLRLLSYGDFEWRPAPGAADAAPRLAPAGGGLFSWLPCCSEVSKAPAATVVAGTAAAKGSIADELNSLAQLKQAGALSDAEFQAAKAKLLTG